MKLISFPLEAAAIKNICELDSKYSSLLLGKLTEDHFSFSEGNQNGPFRSAFLRILKIAKTGREIPTLSELCCDPVLDEDHRKVIEQLCKRIKRKANTLARVYSLVNGLGEYQKLRDIRNLQSFLLTSISSKKVDVSGLLSEAGEKFLKINTDTKKDLLHIGHEDNSGSLVETFFKPLKKQNFVPTGFQAFDSINKGIFKRSLFTISSESGGGKSMMGVQLLINMTSLGYNCALVTLEMSEEEMISRIMSNLTGISPNRHLSRNLSQNEFNKSRKVWGDYTNKLTSNKSRFTVFDPEGDLSIEEALFSLKPFGYEVILIDYVTLLKGSRLDDFASIGDIAKFSKNFAKQNNVIVILIAQLNREGYVKYAGALTEHSNNCWIWRYGDAERESGEITIRQAKARNQSDFSFKLKVDYDSARIVDISETTMGQSKDNITNINEAHTDSAKTTRDKVNKKSRDAPSMYDPQSEYFKDS